MDSKSLHNICTRALSSVSWASHGANEYVVVGDGVSVDQGKLQNLVNSVFTSSDVFLSVDRHIGFAVSSENVAAEVANHLRPNGYIVVTDNGFHNFLQISSIGVARTGVAA
jgi:hypothetical protein